MTPSEHPDIVVTDRPLERAELARLLQRFFYDMVKYVVDVRTGRVAVGGELHADAEGLLLETGSAQQDLWGANYYPGRGPEGCIEYTALINIRPAQENPGMEVEDRAIRDRLREVTFVVLGRGDPL
ncbi:MAG: DUF5674 family protein [Gemmatimonadales bacterium]|nr:DUF5674 family protein [Gemmatimonadales bacterium]